MYYFLIVLSLICSYLIGSFPTAYLIGKLRKKEDIRKVGSKNMGAMNVFYKVGVIEGLVVLTIDILKGAAGVAVAKYLGSDYIVVQMLGGFLAVVGHNLPIFLKFKGGKGGATAIGVLIFFMPWGVPTFLVIFLPALYFLHNPTFAYSISFIVFPFVAAFIDHSWPLIVYSCLLPLVPFARFFPRFFEMRKSGGSWKHVFYRKNLKDRL
ncbi:MAG: glycerol-3-phosphate acyltransferase [Dehalococcoidales bacterium]|nr:glycerol-3-phosphate acyltransferase [Dehalococcoidales bacterium]